MRYNQTDLYLCAMTFAVDVYKATQVFPKEEMFGLRSQMRRAAVSIPANIAEGAGRTTFRDEKRCISIARGSLYELETQIKLCRRLGYISADAASQLNEWTTRVAMLINGTLRSLRQRSRPTTNE